ncbi:MAG: flagellar biosynthetic protein FliO [Erythrobacter sp.]
MTLSTLFSSLLAIIISLGFVVALAWGTLWLLKRFQDGSFGRLSGAETGKTLRFEKALPVGPRERLVLVEVEGEHLLLGVTAHAITPIKSWPAMATGENGTDKPDAPDKPDTVSADAEQAAKRFRLRMADSDVTGGKAP